MADEDKKQRSRIDGNSIVSPKNTRRLYGNKKLDQDEPVAGQTDETPTSLPENLDYVDENIFPSAP